MLGLENRSRIFHRGTVALGLTICHLKENSSKKAPHLVQNARGGELFYVNASA
jgi:hypothetical protein